MTARCWCDHDEAHHIDAICVTCQKWLHWLDPKHQFRPIDTLKPISPAIYKPVTGIIRATSRGAR